MKPDFIYTETSVYHVEEDRIFVNRNLLAVPRDQVQDRLVTFTYKNVKTGKTSTREMTYKQATDLAERRWLDRRYKNYEFYVG